MSGRAGAWRNCRAAQTLQRRLLEGWFRHFLRRFHSIMESSFILVSHWDFHRFFQPVDQVMQALKFQVPVPLYWLSDRAHS